MKSDPLIIPITDWSPCISQTHQLGCGACCIAPSISSAIPGMPDGKPAGVRCVTNLRRLFTPRAPCVMVSCAGPAELMHLHTMLPILLKRGGTYTFFNGTPQWQRTADCITASSSAAPPRVDQDSSVPS